MAAHPTQKKKLGKAKSVKKKVNGSLKKKTKEEQAKADAMAAKKNSTKKKAK